MLHLSIIITLLVSGSSSITSPLGHLLSSVSVYSHIATILFFGKTHLWKYFCPVQIPPLLSSFAKMIKSKGITYILPQTTLSGLFPTTFIYTQITDLSPKNPTLYYLCDFCTDASGLRESIKTTFIPLQPKVKNQLRNRLSIGVRKMEIKMLEILLGS